MARRARCDSLPPAGVYHVTARGVARQAISVDDHDRVRFVVLLNGARRQKGWQLLAYCLMPNHFHLVVACALERLSDGMHFLNFRYAQRFNERHDRIRHLFQDRFGARAVEGDEHFENVCEYVLNNPVRAGLCAELGDWRWSGGELLGDLRGRVYGRERRRPRAERRGLAAAAVQEPITERMLGLHHLVDLRGALVDDRRARVPEVALDPELTGVAVRAEDLDREVRGLERRLGRMPLGEGGLARVALPLVLHPRRLHDEQLRGLVAEHHLRDHVLHELVATDRLPERLALPRVLDGPLQARTHDADAAGGGGDTALFERVHRDLEPVSLLADEVLGRHLDVLEEELAGRPRPDAELVLGVARREPLHALLEDEGADSLVAGSGIGLREDERVISDGRVRDPVLLTVEDVGVTFAPRRRPHRRDVGAGVRLGQAEACELLALRLWRQPPLLLVLRAVLEQRERVEADVHRDQRAERRLAALDLLARERLRHVVEARAAVLLRQDDAEDPELRHALDQLEVELVVDVVLHCDRQDALVHELADRVLDQPLLVGQLEIHRRQPICTAPRRSPPSLRSPGSWAEQSSSSRATCGCTTTRRSPRPRGRPARWCRCSSSTRRSSIRPSGAPRTAAGSSHSPSPTSTSRSGSSGRAWSCAGATRQPRSPPSRPIRSMRPRMRAGMRRRARSGSPHISTSASYRPRRRLRSTISRPTACSRPTTGRGATSPCGRSRTCRGLPRTGSSREPCRRSSRETRATLRPGASGRRERGSNGGSRRDSCATGPRAAATISPPTTRRGSARTCTSAASQPSSASLALVPRHTAVTGSASSAGAISTRSSCARSPRPPAPISTTARTREATLGLPSTRGATVAPAIHSSMRACASSHARAGCTTARGSSPPPFPPKTPAPNRAMAPPGSRSCCWTATSRRTAATGSGSPAPESTTRRVAGCSTRRCRRSGATRAATTCAGTCPSSRTSSRPGSTNRGSSARSRGTRPPSSTMPTSRSAAGGASSQRSSEVAGA